MSSADRGGIWITFEGIEGSGKSTQIERLAKRLGGTGREVVTTREPGGTELGRALRALLLHPTDAPMHPLAELMLYAADRVQHLHELVLPALDRGAIVLQDRFLDATLAYQGYGRGLGTASVLELHRRPPLDRRPHATVLIDLEPHAALVRARRRDARSGLSAVEGRFEQEELDFHCRVREGYLELAQAEIARIHVVNGGGEVDAVARRVHAVLHTLLGDGAE